MCILFCRGDENEIESDLALDLVKFNFWEDGLIRETNGVVTTAVERFEWKTAEVADVRAGHRNEALEEFPHVGPTKCHTCSDGFALTDFKVCNGLTGKDY